MFRSFLLTMILVMMGCQPSPSTREESSAPGFPITIEDGLKRSVTLSAPAKRIVSLTPAATEIIFALGAGDRVVAVTSADDFPAQVKKLPQVGGFGPQTISMESVLAQRPDLVLVWGPYHDRITGMLEELGVTVVAIDGATLDDVILNTELIAKLLAVDTGLSLIQKYNEKLNEYRQKKRINTWKTLYVLTDEPLMTVGGNTFMSEVIAVTGGENIFANLEQPYPRISDEAILQAQPDVIVLPKGIDSKLKERLFQRPGWNQLQAYKQGHILEVNEDHISRLGPRIFLALEELEAGFAGLRN